MPLRVEEFNSELTFSAGEMPLSDEQIEAIVERVKRGMDDDRRDTAAIAEATKLRAKATPPTVVDQ